MRIDYTDKIAGTDPVTGEISAADMNQIKAKFNQLAAALFDLNQDGSLTTGKIKASALADVDIFTGNFNTADFIVSNGLISLNGSGTPLPIPAAPTAFVVDDAANTAGWTDQGGLTFADMDISFNSGGSYQQVTAKPMPVGDVAYAIGAIKLRYRATSERQASAAISNATAYTVAGGGSSSDAGYLPIDSLQQSGVMTLSDVNTLSSINQADGGQDFNFAAYFNKKVAVGVPFVVQFTAFPTKGSPWIGLYNTNNAADYVTRNGLFVGFLWVRSSDTSGKMQAKTSVADYKQSSVFTFTVNPKCRMRSTGTRIYFEYSTDNGVTWIDIAPAVNQPAPTTDMWLRFYSEYDSQTATNLLQTGLV